MLSFVPDYFVLFIVPGSVSKLSDRPDGGHSVDDTTKGQTGNGENAMLKSIKNGGETPSLKKS